MAFRSSGKNSGSDLRPSGGEGSNDLLDIISGQLAAAQQALVQNHEEVLSTLAAHRSPKQLVPLSPPYARPPPPMSKPQMIDTMMLSEVSDCTDFAQGGTPGEIRSGDNSNQGTPKAATRVAPAKHADARTSGKNRITTGSDTLAILPVQSWAAEPGPKVCITASAVGSTSSTVTSMVTSVPTKQSGIKIDGAESAKTAAVEVLSGWLTMDKSIEGARSKGTRRKRGFRTRKMFTADMHLGVDDEYLADNQDNDSQEEEASQLDQVMMKIIIKPTSSRRGAWDLLGLLLVTYDMIALPLQIFNLPRMVFWDIMAWFSRLFWTVDFTLAFITGYVTSDGAIEMSFQAIIKRYSKTWLGLDVSLVAIDWAEVFVSENGALNTASALRAGKLSRIFRVLRLVRLLRMARMREVLRFLKFGFTSERLVILIDITQIILALIGMSHLIACVWYGIGTSNEGTWLRAEGVEEFKLEHQYMMCLHWALSQLTGGMDEIHAVTFIERVYNVFAFLLCFVCSALCVSTLTSSMTRLHMLTSRRAWQLSVLRRYLIQNGITDRLALRVQRNALHAVHEQERLMDEDSVELLRNISIPLRVEIHFEMYSPVVDCHPFFRSYLMECPIVVCRICHEAISTLLLYQDDLVFSTGEVPSIARMYTVCSGTLRYYHMEGASTQVRTEDWVSEAALWTHWMHRGELKATASGRLAMLDAAKFMDISCKFDHVGLEPKKYALEFVHYLNSGAPEEVTDLPLGAELRLLMASGGAPVQKSSVRGVSIMENPPHRGRGSAESAANAEAWSSKAFKPRSAFFKRLRNAFH